MLKMIKIVVKKDVCNTCLVKTRCEKICYNKELAIQDMYPFSDKISAATFLILNGIMISIPIIWILNMLIHL